MSLLKKYGPCAMVTGASSGIGEAFARELARQGFDLILVARRQALLDTLAEELVAEHAIKVRVLVADLSTEQGVRGLLTALGDTGISLLVSNAGFGLKGDFTGDSWERIQAMVNTNAVAPMLLAYELLPKMAEAGRGGVIFTGSIEGEAGFPWSTAYAASKAFVHSLGGGLWKEYRDRGVDVLVLSPGSTDTDAPRLQGISDDQLLGVMPPGRVASEALAALGRRSLYIPGWHNRAFVRLLRWLPRSWALGMAGEGMKRAIENSRK